MKRLFFALIAPIFFIGLSPTAQGQSPSSKIMDTSVDWTNSSGGGVNGHVQVFLTDTIGITGLIVNYGSTDTTTNYFTGNYTIPGSFSSSGCTTDINNVLKIPIGHFAASVSGYLRISVLLNNGTHNDIDFVK